MDLLCQHLSLLIHTQIQSRACITLPLYYACTGHDSDFNTFAPGRLAHSSIMKEKGEAEQSEHMAELPATVAFSGLQWPSPVLNVGDLHLLSLYFNWSANSLVLNRKRYLHPPRLEMFLCLRLMAFNGNLNFSTLILCYVEPMTKSHVAGKALYKHARFSRR